MAPFLLVEEIAAVEKFTAWMCEPTENNLNCGVWTVFLYKYI